MYLRAEKKFDRNKYLQVMNYHLTLIGLTTCSCAAVVGFVLPDHQDFLVGASSDCYHHRQSLEMTDHYISLADV